MTEYNIITSDYFSNYSNRIFKFKKKSKKKKHVNSIRNLEMFADSVQRRCSAHQPT